VISEPFAAANGQRQGGEMRLLILGGTVFLGRHIAEYALGRGHEVAIFTRGQRNPDLFPAAERLRGDRDGDLSALAGRRWDAVIDTSGYVPRIVRASAEALADRVERYIFISTISVYADYSRVGMAEDGPIGTLADPTVEAITGETYGPLKALCESSVEAVFPGGALIIRPGLIVGPHDQSDRFTYWPGRVAHGGPVLVPRTLDRAIQIIDVRDLAAWTVRLAEERATGVFNATGPDRTLMMRELFDTCREAAGPGNDAAPVVVAEDFLLERGVGPWMEIPLWMPDRPEMAGFFAIDCRRAFAAGLTFRPLAETVRDTLAWDRGRPADTPRRAGLAPEREAELLREWREKA
jgi:2'-hydroxyisoflavone reductase